MARAQDVRGIFMPNPTVFDGKGEIDEATTTELVDWYLEARVHGFFVLGSFGQGAACRKDQREWVAEMVVQRVKGRVPVVIQVGAVDPYTSIELGKHARRIGADGIGLVGPYYYSDRTEWELIEHFKMVDRAVGLPTLIYNNPPYSGYPITPQLMAKIKEAVPNVFGAKLAKGTLNEAKSYIRALPPGFSTFVPIENMLPGLLCGVTGTITPPIALAPDVGVEFIRAIDAKDFPTAVELQLRIGEFQDKMSALWKVYGRAVLGHGLRLRGFAVKEYPRWPSRPITPTDEQTIREALHALGALPVRA